MFVFGKYGDGVAVKEDLAAVVIELTYAEKVVLEGGHYLAAAGGKVGQVEVGRVRGGVDVDRGVAYMGCGSVQIDVAYWGGGCDVYVTCACVVDSFV